MNRSDRRSKQERLPSSYIRLHVLGCCYGMLSSLVHGHPVTQHYFAAMLSWPLTLA